MSPVIPSNGVIPSEARDLLFQISDFAPAARAILVATLIVGVAGVAATLAWRASASARHVLWLLALGAALGAAVVAAAGPVLEIEAEAVVNGPGVVPGPEPFTPGTPAGTRTVSVDVTALTERAWVDAIRENAPAMAMVLWLIGALTVLARYAIGHLAINRLIGRARLAHAGMGAVVRRGAKQADVNRSFVVKVSSEIESPFTVGVLRPVVILPESATEWDAERLRIVLVHELAHVARLDYATQLVATAACAVYWFNPVVWLAAARLRAEAEQAADDRVLAAGVDGITYASHLLELARPDGPRLSSAVAVGMARSNRLERRFRAMLDTTRSRGTVPLRVQAAGAIAVVLMAVPLVGFRMIPVPQAAPPVTVTTTPTTQAFAQVTLPTTAARTRLESARPTTSVNAAVTTAGIASDTVVDRTVAAAAGERISIDLRTGGNIVVRSWDQPRVRVRATLTGDESRETRVELARVSGGVELRATVDRWRSNSRNSNSFEVWVPKRFDVDINSSGGGVDIDGVQGKFTGRTGGGEITMTNVRGEAQFTTGGGEVHVASSHLDGRISTGGGEASVTAVTGNVSVTSGSGPVIRSGQSARSIGVGGVVTADIGGSQGTVIGRRSYNGSISVSQSGGDIDLADVAEGGQLTTGGGDIRIGASGGNLNITTGGGNIEVGRMSGNVAATTGAGDVQITVVNADGSTHNVEVRSGSGRVIIDLPANIDARLDLESGYTERNGPTTVKSDFPIEVTETTEWDGRNGTPRRYVRGVGSVGAGRGLIRIRTVNGDVVIRRR